MDLTERLAAVDAALKLQLAVGTSHLQAVEMAPQAFGLTTAARPAIKTIRKRHDADLHAVPHVAASKDTVNEDQEASHYMTTSNNPAADEGATRDASTTPCGTSTDEDEFDNAENHLANKQEDDIAKNDSSSEEDAETTGATVTDEDPKATLTQQLLALRADPSTRAKLEEAARQQGVPRNYSGDPVLDNLGANI